MKAYFSSTLFRIHGNVSWFRVGTINMFVDFRRVSRNAFEFDSLITGTISTLKNVLVVNPFVTYSFCYYFLVLVTVEQEFANAA